MPSRPNESLGTAVAVLAALMFLDAHVARADDRQQCVAASEKAQQYRNAGKLSDARDQLQICSRSECPKLIQQDCTNWMSEVLGILPSIVPGAKDRKGNDMVDVTVSIDNKVVADTLDGKAIVLDPGVHVIKFETKKAPTIEERVVIRPNEKNRILTITFATPEDPPPKKDPSAKKERPPNSDEQTPPYAAYVTGGIGILALGAALFVDLDANADARTLRTTCAPQCEQSQVDDIQNRRVIAGVTAALGAAAVIAGVVLFFTHGSSSNANARTSASRFIPPPIRVPVPGLTGAGFTF